MTTAAGLDAQFGFVDESTYGTFAVPTRFMEFVSESLKQDIERIESKGIRAGRKTLHRWAGGVKRVAGDVSWELAPQGIGLLFKHMFGAVSTAGTNPFTHTFTPGQIDGKSFTCQVGRPDISGTVRAFSYLGCKITDWEISAAINEYIMAKVSIYGAAEDTGQTLATASYPTGLSPFVFTHGSITLAGSAFDVIEFQIAGANGLQVDRHRISANTSTQTKEPKEADLHEFTGSLKADFTDLTAYNRFVNGTEAALVLTANAGASAQLSFTTNVRFDGETPNIGGRDIPELSLPFKCVSATSDAAALTAALVNTDSTP